MSTKTAKASARRTARNPRAIQAEDLLQLVGVSDAQTSPDARTVLFTRKVIGKKNAYETALWLADAAGKRAPRAQVLVLSGSLNNDAKRAAKSAGYTFMQKPAPPRDLIAWLERNNALVD